MSFSTPSYITREKLSELMQKSPGVLAIVDVRDQDHIGGHIKGSKHVPSTTIKYQIPELVQTLNDKKVVVFHCALSQQRGPDAARRYLWERERRAGDRASAEGAPHDESSGEPVPQEVLILDGGFTKWQEKFGRDSSLTENYDAGIWAFGT